VRLNSGDQFDYNEQSGCRQGPSKNVAGSGMVMMMAVRV
jgi:hypothetical protein